MKFYIVDAFSSVAFGGNPAGIVILDKNQDFPEKDTMIKTAAELRYSETAFIKVLDDDTFNIRYFTPTDEVDLCGHATIASFTALIKEGLVESGKQYLNKTLAGDLTIDIDDKTIMMEMATPEHISDITTPEALEEIYSIMGIKHEQVIVEKTENIIGELFPKIISTGLPDIMLPVMDLKTLSLIAPNMPQLSDLSKRYNVTGVHAFALGSDDATAHTRNFAPLFGIDEEAATGTASGALAYYLNQEGIISDNAEFSFIQGEDMNRPSRILGKLQKVDDQLKIKVGGTGVILADGNIFI